MSNSIFYSFKIENISFETTNHLTISTPFVKNDAVANCKRELAKIGYKMAADQSHRFIKINDELYMEGMAYFGESPDDTVVKGYLSKIIK